MAICTFERYEVDGRSVYMVHQLAHTSVKQNANACDIATHCLYVMLSYFRTALEGAILSRYLPESMLLRTQLDSDPQFQLALEIAKNRPRYEAIIKGPLTADSAPPAAPKLIAKSIYSNRL